MNILHKVVFNNTVELFQKLLNNQALKTRFDSKTIQSVLDVGMGSGVSTKVLKKLYPHLHIEGLDIDNMLWPENQEFAITVYDGNRSPFDDKSFDLSLIFFVLHHAKNPEQVLFEAKRVTKRYVLVVEELRFNAIQNVAMVLYDMLVNFVVFGHFIQLPHFKTEKQLRSLFAKIKLPVMDYHVIKKGLFITKVAYLLENES